MKSLLIIRHAKSSWDSSVLNDFDRPLNDRGKKDAPEMAQRLTEKNITIDAFVASPAKRAKKTAEFFIEKFKRDKKEIIFIPSLYHAPVEIFNQVVSGLNDAHNSVAIFSHNPGITSFVNSLTDVKLDNMPTCSVFAVTAETNSWSNFFSVKKEFWFFDYPRSI
ncbi:MAG: histidine phosphatase family protein [Bacteroidetes bacterium]|nr:histidine phosphatase family protein [Bacteroidota bacterium]MBS1933215.1 histidine phosphatase family protein [Bacteroidota bacterium]